VPRFLPRLANRARPGRSFVNWTRGYSPGAVEPGDVCRTKTPDPAEPEGGSSDRVEGCDWEEGDADLELAARWPDEVPDEVIAEGPATADEEAAGAGARSDLTGAGVGTGGGA